MVETPLTPSKARDDERLARLRRLAWWLDDGFRLPGTQIRIGLDPILGLLPGVGDAAGALLGAAILVEASRRQVPRTTLVRIAANIALDTTVGAVPLVGDVFDAAWKSNRRNLQLLERHSIEPLKARRADRIAVGALVALLVAISAGLLVGVAFLSVAVMKLLTGS